MALVEQISPGCQWAEPVEGRYLEVKLMGRELQVTGAFPNYGLVDAPSDFVRQYEKAPKTLAVGQKRNGKESPERRFANADSDEKLIDFVRRFGPVVATRIVDGRLTPVDDGSELRLPFKLTAYQDIQELRNEREIYHAALGLVAILGEGDCDFKCELARGLISEIATRVSDWPKQWDRERLQRHSEPVWKLRKKSLERIVGLNAVEHVDPLLPPSPDGRIVICELVNTFRGYVFPNVAELHSEIKFGIRPLLYSILRRQFIAPRDFALCANTRCRSFFHIERAGDEFCCSECSQQQRQRDYWHRSGNKLRRKRRKALAIRKE